MKKSKSIALLIPYFGKWPEWIDLFFDSVERNSTVDFHFLTNCNIKVSNAPNVFFHEMSFEAYVDNAQKCLGVHLNIPNPYKICDLRPMFGIIHFEIIKNYDFYGWTDVDLLFGDIRSFYTEEILRKFEVLSTHAIRISGHLAIIKNTNYNRNKYLSIYNWKGALQNPEFVGIDEHGITNAYTMTIFDKFNEKFQLKIDNSITRYFKRKKTQKLYLVEQFTTPFTPIPWIDGTINSYQPSTWFYHQGKVTNSRDRCNFIYIHFMNFKSSKWRHDSTSAPWENKTSIFNVNKSEFNRVIGIDHCGINVMP